jgi:hypothetical protein
MADYPETLAQSLARLEPDSGWEGCAHDKVGTPDLRIQLSIAISLKRIADVLANPHSIGGYIEDIAFNAGRAFFNGNR